MKVILYVNDCMYNPDHALFHDRDADEKIAKWKDSLQKIEPSYSSLADFSQTVYDVPKYSYLSFYVGDELRGRIPVENESLVDQYCCLSEDFVSKKVQHLAEVYLSEWAPAFFETVGESYYCDINNRKLYRVVGREYRECRMVLENTIALGLEGYKSYTVNPSEDIAIKFAEQIDYSGLIAWYTPNAIGVVTLKSVDDMDMASYTIENYSTLEELVDKVNNYSSPIQEVVRGIPTLPVIFVVKKKSLFDINPDEITYEDTIINPELLSEALDDSRPLIKAYVNAFISNVCKTFQVESNGENFKAIDSGKLLRRANVDILCINWLEFKVDRIYNVTIGESEVDCYIETWSELGDCYLEFFDTAFNDSNPIPIDAFREI